VNAATLKAAAVMSCLRFMVSAPVCELTPCYEYPTGYTPEQTLVDLSKSPKTVT
jgi:hypothetical protein